MASSRTGDGRRRRAARAGGQQWNKERTKELFRRYKEEGDEEARNELIANHFNLVRHVASKYARSGVPLEDLVQAGSVGLINAVDRFDPSFGYEFTTFAMPTIRGEIKHYFRDKNWTIGTSRKIKDFSVKVRSAQDELSVELQRSPTLPEIAERAGISVEEVINVLDSVEKNKMIPLEVPSNGDDESSSVIDSYRAEDEDLLAVNDRIALADAMSKLSSSERQLLTMYYIEDKTQKAIGEELGISQVQVSRLIKSAVAHLRKLVNADDES